MKNGRMGTTWESWLENALSNAGVLTFNYLDCRARSKPDFVASEGGMR